MRSKLTCIFLLLFVASCSNIKHTVFRTTPDSKTITQQVIDGNSNITTRLYEVRTTDTLISVAKAHNTTPQVLITLNNFKKPYTIIEGQLIKVPVLAENAGGRTEERRVVYILPKQ